MASRTTLKHQAADDTLPIRARLVWLHGPGTAPAPRVITVRGHTPIGRALEADVGVSLPDDPRVSRLHAELTVHHGDEVILLTDRSSTGTFVNGHPIATGRIGDGDIMRVGDTFFVARIDRSDPSGDKIDRMTSGPPRMGMVGTAPSVELLRERISLAGPSPATVLLIGESGTGKEVVARALHKNSGRQGPFVAVNCSAIPDALAESQLFGHVAGAFTGARSDAPGYFRAAHLGTLFLDELGELPPALQPKLLRAIEERTITPVGATRSMAVDLRIIAATNRSLEAAARDGAFRGDLYARVAEIVLDLPPLRERKEDVLPLLRHFLASSDDAAVERPGVAGGGEGEPNFAPDLVEALLCHDWPYNVRELRTTATQLRVYGASAAQLQVQHLAGRLERTRAAVPREPVSSDPSGANASSSEGAATTMPPPIPVSAPASAPMPVPTREALVALLVEHGGVIADIARETGRSRKQVYRWLEQHALAAEDYRQG